MLFINIVSPCPLVISFLFFWNWSVVQWEEKCFEEAGEFMSQLIFKKGISDPIFSLVYKGDWVGSDGQMTRSIIPSPIINTEFKTVC